MKEIFALDIGTRKVMGIVAQVVDGVLNIIDVEVIEHPSRSMFDGQIHSIDEVVKVVKTVKENLEERLKKNLDKAGVAVAGRSLQTYKSKVEREIPPDFELTAESVRNLEMEAVDKIISLSKISLEEFHCVGYSPLYYELDGNRILNLSGHRGKKASVEVIATFLPRVVLDSILSVFDKAGLEPVNITLEPIAAINAIIPADMRYLNIVLVDIGAGTSDLALSRQGAIFAYGMVPEAGDEITESVCEQLLVDFITAERIKRALDNSLGREATIEYEDIWGKYHSLEIRRIQEKIAPSVKKLAEAIAQEALRLNEGLPQAVVCEGGGSLTYNLITELANSLGLPFDKVGIRLPKAIRGINDLTGKLTGPEAVTPLGIALMTADSYGLKFIEVCVNGSLIRMLDFRQKKDILGALILSGIDNKKLYPRPGLALIVDVNGESKVIKGSLGTLVKISLNGQAVDSLANAVNQGDVIDFQEAVDGENARACVKDVVDIKPVEIVFNRKQVLIMPQVFMNGRQVSLDIPLADSAHINTVEADLKAALEQMGAYFYNEKSSRAIQPGQLSSNEAVNSYSDGLRERQALVNINGIPRVLTQRNFTLLLNGELASLNTKLKNNDSVEFYPERPTFYRIKDVLDIPQKLGVMQINVDGKEVFIQLGSAQVFMNGQEVSPEEFLIDGSDIKVYPLKEKAVVLSDIFKYIDIDIPSVRGRMIRFLVNDLPAGYTTPLTQGAKVRIVLEEKEREGYNGNL